MEDFTWKENWRMSLRRSMSKGLVVRLLAKTLPPWKTNTSRPTRRRPRPGMQEGKHF